MTDPDYAHAIADTRIKLWRFSDEDRDIVHELLALAARDGFIKGMEAQSWVSLV